MPRDRVGGGGFCQANFIRGKGATTAFSAQLLARGCYTRHADRRNCISLSCCWHSLRRSCIRAGVAPSVPIRMRTSAPAKPVDERPLVRLWPAGPLPRGRQFAAARCAISATIAEHDESSLCDGFVRVALRSNSSGLYPTYSWYFQRLSAA